MVFELCPDYNSTELWIIPQSCQEELCRILPRALSRDHFLNYSIGMCSEITLETSSYQKFESCPRGKKYPKFTVVNWGKLGQIGVKQMLKTVFTGGCCQMQSQQLLRTIPLFSLFKNYLLSAYTGPKSVKTQDSGEGKEDENFCHHGKISCCCCHCCSVAKSCLTLCNPMDCSKLGSSVLYCLLEFAQIHVH